MPARNSADLPAFRRPRFFDGRLLSAADVQLEQQYLRQKAQLHNRLLHGWGVVDGLDVRSSGGQIVVSTGVALDSAGNTIVLREACAVNVAPSSTKQASMFVVIRYDEQLIDPITLVVAGAEIVEHLHLDEGATCSVEPAAPRSPDLGVTLARVIWRTTQWRVDARFRRRRVRT